jgi:molybdenum cofactor cytidylyltransferase
MNVTAIVLAAGASTRMGSVKQLLPYRGTTMLGAVLDSLLATCVGHIIVVLGYHAEKVREAIGERAVEVVVNPDPSRGMLSSVQCGISAAVDTDLYLIALGDQPRLQAATVDTLISAAGRSPQSIFLPTFAGKRGHPLLMRAAHRDAILRLPLSVGLNAFVAEHGGEVEEVPVDAPAILEDIDTPDDFARLAGVSANER